MGADILLKDLVDREEQGCFALPSGVDKSRNHTALLNERDVPGFEKRGLGSSTHSSQRLGILSFPTDWLPQRCDHVHHGIS
jgi:hypothetical protein